MRSSSRKLAYVSPILRASEPSGASPLLASAMRSAVRFAVSSLSTEKVPKTLRSGGISVLSYQPPFANRKKSSPGFTERSIPARSRPDAEDAAAPITGAAWAGVPAGPPDVTVAATAPPSAPTAVSLAAASAALVRAVPSDDGPLALGSGGEPALPAVLDDVDAHAAARIAADRS